MKCPVCGTSLTQAKYEGVPIYHCLECRGFLASRSRAMGIRHKADRSPEILLDEAKTQLLADTRKTIRCPTCRDLMRKESIPGAAQFKLDVCHRCDLIWFDGGELALFQLAWEASPQGQESAKMQERHQNMSDEERAQLEADIDALPRSSLLGSLLDAFRPPDDGLD
ncbi:MAG: zf-TFIIB domain-containing protein [Planctomycetaceae bacterium]|nr:zf-TFIIB domain-containing protein [Planctomycetaceae bacterium]